MDKQKAEDDASKGKMTNGGQFCPKYNSFTGCKNRRLGLEVALGKNLNMDATSSRTDVIVIISHTTEVP